MDNQVDMVRTVIGLAIATYTGDAEGSAALAEAARANPRLFESAALGMIWKLAKALSQQTGESAAELLRAVSSDLAIDDENDA
jgi:hypothetical protein